MSMSLISATPQIISKILEENNFELVSDKMSEIVDFVRNVSGSEHLLVLWNDPQTKDKLVSEFFNKAHSGNSKGYFSVNPYDDNSVDNTIYEKYFEQHGTQFLPQAVDKVVATVGANNSDSSTRYAFEDDTWLIERGQTEQLIRTEEQLGKKIDENLSLFCFDNISRLDEAKLKRMIPAHGYVLLTNPLSLYKFRNL